MDAARRDQAEVIPNSPSTASFNQRAQISAEKCPGDTPVSAKTEDQLNSIDSIAIEAITFTASMKDAGNLQHSLPRPGLLGLDQPEAIVGRQIGPYEVSAWIGGSGISNVFRDPRR